MQLSHKLLVGMVLGLLAGCDDGPRTRTPPVGATGETVEDLRNRRRENGTFADENPARPFDSEFDRTDFGESGRQETLRPDAARDAARAAEEAEDLRDAAADRPRRP